jgi:hypothetical protein
MDVEVDVTDSAEEIANHNHVDRVDQNDEESVEPVGENEVDPLLIEGEESNHQTHHNQNNNHSFHVAGGVESNQSQDNEPVEVDVESGSTLEQEEEDAE